MTPVNRWKLISFVLAGTITYSWWHGEARSHTSVQAAAHARLERRSGARAAAVVAMSSDEVVQRLFSAKDIEDVQALAERLGVIGDNDAIDAVKPLLADAREGVPEAILEAHRVGSAARRGSTPERPVHAAAARRPPTARDG